MARALQSQGLVKVNGHRPGWMAALTDAGLAVLAAGAPVRPVARSASARPPRASASGKAAPRSGRTEAPAPRDIGRVTTQVIGWKAAETCKPVDVADPQVGVPPVHVGDFGVYQQPEDITGRARARVIPVRRKLQEGSASRLPGAATSPTF